MFVILRNLVRRRRLARETAELDSLSAAWDDYDRGEGPHPARPAPPPPPPGGWFPCPCCGHQTFGSQGGYEICDVCFWEDDPAQLRHPLVPFGPNQMSLVQAQQNYRRIGAVREDFVSRVEQPGADEPLDPGWRPIDLSRDSFEDLGEAGATWPEDHSVLYWWRPTFWRRPLEPDER